MRGAKAAEAGDAHVSRGQSGLRFEGESDVETIGGQITGRAIRPFQKRHRALRGVVETKLGQLG